MPIYEYRCKECEAEFEKYAWPTCASEQVMRKLSVFGLETVGALSSDMSSGMSGGGGCCGGGCACH